MSDMTINEAIEAGHNPDWCESCETPEEQTEAQRVIEAAAEIFTHFERGERDSEATEAKIWIVKDREMYASTVALCLEAHTDPDGDQILPNDWTYEYIVDALGIISGQSADAELDDILEAEYEIEGEIYTSNLTRWYASHSYRHAYTDAACAEFGESNLDTNERITLGNRYEQQFIFRSVLKSVAEIEGVYIDGLSD